jgi:ubiquinone/menaquinone biosynthesis C-methylase UbiE
VQDNRYALGYSDAEAKRLERQAALSGDILEDGLRRGGLSEGMNVLDIGSGLGHVAFCAAGFVGASGSVTGVERWRPWLEFATARAAQLGLANVRFVEADLEVFDPLETYDAIVGRFILQYLPFASELLSRLKRRLRPGGIVIFQELDNSGAVQHPPSALFQQVNGWIAEAFKATGSIHDMGALLPRVYVSAGLPRPEMISMGRVESGPDTPFYEFLTDVLRIVLPVLEKTNVVAREEIQIETLAERLRADAVAHDRTLYSARVVTAWTRTP